MVKQRRWYGLDAAERGRIMRDHIETGRRFGSIEINTSYSFGIDDQEFVVAFETNFPEDFVDLVQQLRETEISMYTLKDTPVFSCVRLPVEEMLDRLG
jgi:chlorite dismutase